MSDYSDVNGYMEQTQADLEELFTKLQSFAPFMHRGEEDGDGQTVWPATVVFCPRGHKVSDVQLTYDATKGNWVMHADPNSQSRAGHFGNRDPRTEGVVSLYRTTFTCDECKKKSGSASNHPITGATLLREYSTAVLKGKASFRLP